MPSHSMKELLRERVQIHPDGSKEFWRDIPGYEEFYRISDWGRVKSLARMVGHNWGGLKQLREKIMEGRPSMGYRSVTLRKDGEARTVHVHRLVWLAFCGEMPTGLEINHKDGNRANNHLDNIEAVSHGDNIRHAFQNGMVSLGENRKHTKLTRNEVQQIRQRYADGETDLAALGNEFGVNRMTVYDVVFRKTWKHVP